MQIDFEPIQQEQKKPISSSIDFEPIEENQKDYSLQQQRARLGLSPDLPGVVELAPRFAKSRETLDFIPGAAQGYVNSLVGMANLLPKVNIPNLNFAPDTEASRAGQMFGDIASYFGPRAALGVTKIPHAISNALKDWPVAQTIMKHLGSGAEAALFGASKVPEGEKTEESLKDLGIGSGVSIANALLAHKMPLISRLGSLALGTGLGYGLGHPYYGAAIGAAVPQLRPYLLGPSKEYLAQNALRDVEQSRVIPSLRANERLGTVPTPGQAMGSYVIQGREGALRKAGGVFGEDLERKALEQQTDAAKNMLNKVYKPTKESEKSISDAYARSDKRNIKEINSPEFFAALKDKYPVLNEAFNIVKSDSAFANIPPGNYKFLAEVDRQLGRNYRAALQNNPNSAHIIKNMKDDFRKFLIKNNPDYEEALKLAAPKYAREDLERTLNVHEENLTGKNVYKKLLETPKKYKETLRDLKNYPEAQKDLMAMRKGWKEYANIKTGSQAEAQSKSNILNARNLIDKANDFLEASVGKEVAKKQLQYIHSPEWKKGFDLIEKSKTRRESANKTLDLIGKMGIAYGLSGDEVKNLKDLITQPE